MSRKQRSSSTSRMVRQRVRIILRWRHRWVTRPANPWRLSWALNSRPSRILAWSTCQSGLSTTSTWIRRRWNLRIKPASVMTFQCHLSTRVRRWRPLITAITTLKVDFRCPKFPSTISSLSQPPQWRLISSEISSEKSLSFRNQKRFRKRRKVKRIEWKKLENFFAFKQRQSQEFLKRRREREKCRWVDDTSHLASSR